MKSPPLSFRLPARREKAPACGTGQDILHGENRKRSNRSKRARAPTHSPVHAENADRDKDSTDTDEEHQTILVADLSDTERPQKTPEPVPADKKTEKCKRSSGFVYKDEST